MPNEKDQNLSPDEEPEEKKYSFLQETIKTKPISRQQFARQCVRVAIYGIVLGAFACFGFFAFKPWLQDLFRGNLQTVTIPEDEDTEEQQDEAGTEEETPVIISAESYEEMMASMSERAQEARRGIVYIQPASDTGDWNTRMTGISPGATGVIMADNGQELLILTDSSVSEDAQKWTVTFQDSATYTATLKKRDLNSRVAVFSVSRSSITDSTWSKIKVSVLGNSNLADQGDVVMALGDMFGYADGMGYGIISAAKYKETFYDRECRVISTDITATGDGTGVLFNMDGDVVGLISPSVWEDSENRTVNALAISDLKTVIEILANDERVPYIGINGTTVTDDLKAQGMPAGVYVVDVDPESPAMEAGIQTGDIICEAARTEVSGMSTYQKAVLKTKAGDTIRLKGKRLGADGYVDIDFTVLTGSRE